MKKYFLALAIIGLAYVEIHAQQPYYDDVNLTLTGQDLYFELQNKISEASSTFTYGNARDAALITDENADNTDDVLLIFGYNDTDGSCTTDRSRDKGLFGGNACEWNREHVFARSNANPPMGSVDNASTGIGADPHNIRPSDTQMNNNKGNRIFADGSGHAGVVGAHWYPGDEWKGDVARMMMYMYTRYGDRCLPSLMGTGPLEGATNMLQLYLQWNVDDPVSALEDQRNPHLESVYGNRNPFIDNPYLATLIWGGPAAEDRWYIFSIPEVTTKSISLFPNPASHEVHFYHHGTGTVNAVIVYNLTGKEVMAKSLVTSGSLDISSLSQGLYLLKFVSKENEFIEKLVVQ